MNGWAGVFDQHILDGLMEGILPAGFERRRDRGGWSWFWLREAVLFSKASVTSNDDVYKRNLLPESKFE